MTWSPTMRRGAGLTALATVVFTLASIAYLWTTTSNLDVPVWGFIKMAAIVSFVWAAIGATMGIFIVMILKKNEGRT